MAPPRVEIPHVVRRASGAPAASASVRVYLRGTTTNATVYSAATGTGTLTQPLTTDASGRIEGWVNPGRYDVVPTVDGYAYTQPWDASAGALEAWIAPTLTSPWVNFGGVFQAAKYRKTSEGLVMISGVVTGGSSGSTIFTLPVGYRPAASLLFASMSNYAIARLDVTAAGAVSAVTVSAGSWCSLEPIHFIAEQ